MSTSIRIDDDLYNEAKTTATAEHRSVPMQLMYWARLGKAALENPDLPIEFIKDLLAAKYQKEDREVFEFRNEN